MLKGKFFIALEEHEYIENKITIENDGYNMLKNENEWYKALRYEYWYGTCHS